MNITDIMFADVILIDVCYTGGEQSYICFRTWQCLNLTNHITALTNQIVELQSRVVSPQWLYLKAGSHSFKRPSTKCIATKFISIM